ncbi:MAG: helix-turn-helix domain-containing protein [Thermoguttaceae bacterium]|jgi:HTH-type transcriptional repressor of puuD
MDSEVAQRIQMLRKRCGLSIRQLAGLAGVTPGIISCIERSKNSPSIATLQKILSALGTDLGTFFAKDKGEADGPVFPREHMRAVGDPDRTYTIVFPRRPGVHVEMFDEHLRCSRRRPPFEKLKCDVAVYVLSGTLVLEIKNQPKQTLRPGDACYIAKGVEHRGFAGQNEPVRLISVCHPAKY